MIYCIQKNVPKSEKLSKTEEEKYMYIDFIMSKIYFTDIIF